MKKVLRKLWNLLMTLISLPAYIALILPLLVIVLCEIAKLNSTVIKVLLDGIRKSKEEK